MKERKKVLLLHKNINMKLIIWIVGMESSRVTVGMVTVIPKKNVDH